MVKKNNANLGYVITGLGRSGTTLLAHVFYNAGYDLGGVKPAEIGRDSPIGGGMEYAPFACANIRLQGELGPYWDKPNEAQPLLQKSYAEIALHVAELLEQPWPFVMKDPRFCDTLRIWHAGGKTPQHIFLCIRSPLQRNHSVAAISHRDTPDHRKHILRTHRSFYIYFSIFNVLLFCAEEDIPLTTVLYPRIGIDRAYAEKTLGPFLSNPWYIIQRTWDSKLLHHTPHREKAVLSP